MNTNQRFPRRRRFASAVLACVLVGLASSIPVSAQSPASLFDDGVAAYQRGKFDSAATLFHQLTQGGIDDPRVWYNLGNAHFKSGRIGSALVSFSRGLRLAPRDADLRANFGYVRLFAIDKIENTGSFFLETWWRAAVDRLSLSEARGLTAFLMWLAVLLTVWRLWPGRLRQVSLSIVILGWVVWMVATGASATRYYQNAASRRGAVVSVKTDVRGGPGPDYTLQFVAHDGLLGTIDRSESGWHLVRFPNGLKGWIAARDFDVI